MTNICLQWSLFFPSPSQLPLLHDVFCVIYDQARSSHKAWKASVLLISGGYLLLYSCWPKTPTTSSALLSAVTLLSRFSEKGEQNLAPHKGHFGFRTVPEYTSSLYFLCTMGCGTGLMKRNEYFPWECLLPQQSLRISRGPFPSQRSTVKTPNGKGAMSVSGPRTGFSEYLIVIKI